MNQLKLQHYQQRTAQQEDEIATLRARLTILQAQYNELKEKRDAEPADSNGH